QVPVNTGRHTVPDRLVFTEDGSAVVLGSGDSLVTARAADGAGAGKKPPGKPRSQGVYNPGPERGAEGRAGGGAGGGGGAAGAAVGDRRPGGPRGGAGWGGVWPPPAAFAVSADGKTVAVCPRPGEGARARVTLHATADGKRTGQLPEDDSPDFRLY